MYLISLHAIVFQCGVSEVIVASQFAEAESACVAGAPSQCLALRGPPLSAGAARVRTIKCPSLWLRRGGRVLVKW